MTWNTAALSDADRETLTNTSYAIALLPNAAAATLSTQLVCIAGTRNPGRELLDSAIELARSVRTHVLQDASADRWLADLADLDQADKERVASEMASDCQHQANLVGDVMRILQMAMDNNHANV